MMLPMPKVEVVLVTLAAELVLRMIWKRRKPLKIMQVKDECVMKTLAEIGYLQMDIGKNLSTYLVFPEHSLNRAALV